MSLVFASRYDQNAIGPRPRSSDLALAPGMGPKLGCLAPDLDLVDILLTFRTYGSIAPLILPDGFF